MIYLRVYLVSVVMVGKGYILHSSVLDEHFWANWGILKPYTASWSPNSLTKMSPHIVNPLLAC